MASLSKKSSFTSHHESHNVDRGGWIRAGVMGANDGVVSIAALVMAILASQVETEVLLITSLSALIAGACSMAIGEYVSVSSQRDIELADIAKEKAELKDEPEYELDELTGIYRNRGLSEDLARKVAVELTEHDALKAHMRDELGIVDQIRANPFQAAYVSFIAFSLGGFLPFIAGIMSHEIFEGERIYQLTVVSIVTLLALYTLGYLGAYLGGAPRYKAVVRVLFGGSLALIVTSILGAALG